MNRIHSRLCAGLLILILAALACNLPFSTTSPAPTQDVGAIVSQTLAALSTANSNAPATLTPSPLPPPGTVTPGVVHSFFPTEVQTTGVINYDVDSRGTAPEHRAPYGDSYKLNRFERPFTQNVMDYLPEVDIQKFRIISDTNWYYVFMEVADVNSAGGLTADYGVELDFDRDGHGDFLIWAKPPFGTSWTTEGLTVFSDSNNDTGGLSPERADLNFSGNGYDQVVVSSGRGGVDPDLAWVRIDPHSVTTIQFAFKKSLVGSTFMWGVWADLGLRDPSKFSYNDYFTEEQAGSPEKSETKFYPIKAIYAVDNTCRAAYGFKPTENEPLLCPPYLPPGVTPSPTTPP